MLLFTIRLLTPKKRPKFAWLLGLLCLFTSAIYAQQNADLESIQQQIKNKQTQIKSQLEAAQKLQEVLKNKELQIAKSSKVLNQTQGQLKENQKQQRLLRDQQKEYSTAVHQQKSALAKQIRSAYMTGNYDFAKMLLNQKDAANFERTITYYQYLNKARKSQIEGFNVLVTELQGIKVQLLEAQQELQELQEVQQTQQQHLTSQQTDRQSTLKKIRSTIESDEARIAQLQVNEQSLLEALNLAQQRAQQQALQQQSPTQIRQSKALTGLSQLKGKLLMPAQGNLRKMFGRFRQGQIKWKGVVINGRSGTPVVAIHDAKVLYSDWLRGFGLVTVLDHGDGFMSLYGHNQALLKQAGENVQAGQSIALLGQSGGQNRPNLYFEIRHKGKPINPVRWLKL